MRMLIPVAASALIALTAATLMISPISGADAAEAFPIRGSFGQVGGQGDPCGDARLGREGDYIEVSPNRIFAYTSSDEIASFRHLGGSLYALTLRSPKGRRFSSSISIDPREATYQGTKFQRCAASR